MSIDNPQLEASQEVISPGEMLSKERAVKGLSVADVAQNLKISERYIEALDSNDFEALPESAFIRGYLRNYARQVGLKGEEVVASFDRYTGEGVAKATYLKAGAETPLKSRSHISATGFILSLAAVILAAGLTYLGWDKYRTESISVATGTLPAIEPEDTAEPQPAVTAVSLHRDFVPASNVDEDDESENRSDPEPQSTALLDVRAQARETHSAESGVNSGYSAVTDESTQSAVDAQSQEDVLAEPADGEMRLFVNFSEDCWIEVQDANNKVLVSDLKRAGSKLALNVLAPAKIRLGNAPGVASMSFGGVPVDINSSKRVSSLLLGVKNQG